MVRIIWRLVKPENQNDATGNNGKSKTGDYLGFSVDHMDRSVEPGKDFFHYASGNWIKRHPVPNDKSHWGSFEELMEKNTLDLRNILEHCAATGTSGRERMLGDFYKSAMNTEIIERLGFEPIQEYLNKVDGISTMEESLDYVFQLNRSGMSSIFHSFSRADKKDSSIYSIYFVQGGISLPNRDYYLSESFEEILGFFRKHVEKVFVMYGIPESDAQRYAETVVSLETDFAKVSRSQTELRDAEKNYNRFSIPDLTREFPHLNLKRYLEFMGTPPVEFVVVGQPEFFSRLDTMISEDNIEKFRIHLKWTILNSAASFLFSEMDEEHFDMFSRKIRGQQEPQERWKRSVHVVDDFLGEALGEMYVREHFGQDARERMAILISDIREVFTDRLKNLDWMTDDTKKQALVKFDRFKAKIGHPEKFRDYSSVTIKEDDYFGNAMRAAAFEIERQTKRVGSSVDRDEWFMTPPTINAYFSPPDNEIVFPAGILQPPFFDVTADDAVNYGAIGAVISHEITHGYDDQGRRYDENGNLRDWWHQEDRNNFLKRTKEVVDLYNSLEILPGLHVNGELTLGENIADFGGVSIAYEALQRHLRKNPHLRKDTDGYSPEQRFFISWAQLWRENIREQEARMRASVDTHSPNRFRAVVPVFNHPNFEEAFPDSSGGNSMGKINRKIDIW